MYTVFPSSLLPSGAARAQSVTLSSHELMEVRMIVSAATAATAIPHRLTDSERGGRPGDKTRGGGGAASNLMLTASSLGGLPPARANERTNERERAL